MAEWSKQTASRIAFVRISAICVAGRTVRVWARFGSTIATSRNFRARSTGTRDSPTSFTTRRAGFGEEQYRRLARTSKEQAVREGDLEFWVNLTDYVDSGLFLDHRLTRARIRSEARGKQFLNLFSYTGSFTVYAAAGGAASTTSVDLSRAYLDWAKRNLALNRLDHGKHAFIQADVLEWIEEARGNAYHLILLDPPSFSASKKMRRAFEVQRDHASLLERATALVAAGGSLYFSTNFRGFRLEFRPPAGFGLEELTPDSIPEDFRRKDIHRCWCFRRRA